MSATSENDRLIARRIRRFQAQIMGIAWLPLVLAPPPHGAWIAADLVIGGVLLLAALYSLVMLSYSAFSRWNLGYAMWDSPIEKEEEARWLGVALLSFLACGAYIDWLVSQLSVHAFSAVLSRVDAFYFEMTTLATVGFGDLHPLDACGRLVVALQILANLYVIALTLGGVVSRFADPRRFSRTPSRPNDD